MCGCFPWLITVSGKSYTEYTKVQKAGEERRGTFLVFVLSLVSLTLPGEYKVLVFTLVPYKVIWFLL
jgi:hypothetical protein